MPTVVDPEWLSSLPLALSVRGAGEKNVIKAFEWLDET
jgi:hypothetical protein